MTSKTTTDSKEDSRVSRAIHGGADRIIALIETEKEKEVLSHKAQLKDLESRHNQLKNNAAMVYASASPSEGLSRQVEHRFEGKQDDIS